MPISFTKTQISKDVHLLEDVKVTHVSLVDRPANRTAFFLTKRNQKPLNKSKPTLEKLLDQEVKAWETSDNLDASIAKVASPQKPKGRWVRNKSGHRFFVPETKLRDKVGTKDLAQGKKLPKAKQNRPVQ